MSKAPKFRNIIDTFTISITQRATLEDLSSGVAFLRLNEKQLELDESELERKFKSIIRGAQRVADSSDKNHKMYEDDCINLANHLTELASDIKQHNLMTRQLKVFNEYKEHLNK